MPSACQSVVQVDSQVRYIVQSLSSLLSPPLWDEYSDFRPKLTKVCTCEDTLRDQISVEEGKQITVCSIYSIIVLVVQQCSIVLVVQQCSIVLVILQYVLYQQYSTSSIVVQYLPTQVARRSHHWSKRLTSLQYPNILPYFSVCVLSEHVSNILSHCQKGRQMLLMRFIAPGSFVKYWKMQNMPLNFLKPRLNCLKFGPLQ